MFQYFFISVELKESDDNFIPLSSKCDPDPHVMNLVIWFDGSSFRKTGKSGKIWSMMGMLADLKPSIRSRLENLINFFHLGVSVADNNLFCEKYMDSFANLLDHGLTFTIKDQQKKLSFKIMILMYKTC